MNLRVLIAFTLMTSLLFTAAFAQPASQPATQPAGSIGVPEEDLARIREAAEFAETAHLAGLDWESYYLAFMKLERRKDWTDKQIKFIGIYFGAIQGRFGDDHSAKTFTDAEVHALRDKLEAEIARLKKEATTRPYRKRSE